MFSKKNKKSEDESKKTISGSIDDNEKSNLVETEVKEETKKLKSKEQEYLEGWKRCQADFENYRKRQDERMKELGIIVKEDMVMQIFPVLDNFQISIDHVPEDQKKSPWVTGMMHIQRQLENVLKDNGIEEIEAKEGDIFNPEVHEAVESHQEKEKEEQHKVKKVISKGYKIGDKVIRAVKVIVN